MTADFAKFKFDRVVLPHRLDVVIIATIRADILRMTLSSFKHRLLDNFDGRAIINVDPAGEVNRYSQMDIVKICGQYFDNVLYRTPADCSFSKAVQWCWSKVESDIFFHLEDDWILKRKVCLEEISTLFQDDGVIGVTLNKYGKSEALNCTADRHCKPVRFYNDNYIHNPGFTLNPSFFRTRYIKEVLERFDICKDPESQFNVEDKATASYSQPILLWRVSRKSLIMDTGKKWRRFMSIGIKRGRNKEPTVWLPRNEKSTFTTALSRWYHAKVYALRLLYWKKRFCQR